MKTDKFDFNLMMGLILIFIADIIGLYYMLTKEEMSFALYIIILTLFYAGIRIGAK